MSTVNDQHTVTYQMAFSEVCPLMFRHYALSPTIIIGLAVATAACGWLYVSGDPRTATALFGVQVAMYLGVLLAVLSSSRRQGFRMEPKVLTFDAEQLSAVGPSGSIRCPWSVFSRFTYNGHYFKLQTRDGGVTWVPRKAFSEAQSALFIQFASRQT
jgi:hypothetical protein